MKPIVCVLSIGRLSRAIRQEIKKMDAGVSFLMYEMLLNESARLPQKLDVVDVFVSSGYDAELLKRLTDRPVITIEPSAYDILKALSRAKAVDERPIIISFYKDYLESFEGIANILSVEIIRRSYSHIEELENIIEEEKRRGTRCVIGSGLTCELAEKQGLLSVFIYPQESIRSFLQLAADMAVSLNSETLKRKRLEIVIERGQRGILFVDHAGVISMCNPEAERYFGQAKTRLVGMDIFSFFPDGELDGILAIREEKNNILAKLGDRQYMLSAIPILTRGRLENILFFVEDVASIQKSDRHIRRALTRKGFVAKHDFSEYDTKNEEFSRLLETARNYALSDEAIVILGETGTGKEVLAQSIHNYSRRRENAFVAVNCSTINENLLESELFGYEEGAFTGAKKGGKEGYFEMAHQGTIFLDEIGEISLTLQTKLLRVIQEKELLRVGGTKMIPFDARFLVATNKNLWEMVQNKQFREDLYYRLNVLEIEIPPLRRRKEDVLSLFLTFLSRQQPKLLPMIQEDLGVLEAVLCSYSWPGNVRELENFVKNISVIADSHQITSAYLTALIKQNLQTRIQRQRKEDEPAQEVEDFRKSVDNSSIELKSKALRYEYEEIQKILGKTNGSYAKAAELLGISRTTLWRKMKAFERQKR